MSRTSEIDDHDEMELRAERALNRRMNAQAISHPHPSDPDYPYHGEDDNEPYGINVVDRIMTVYYSINGAPFNPARAGGGIIVGLPFDQTDYLLYRFSKDEIGVSSVSLDGEHEIMTTSHEDIVGRVTHAAESYGKDWMDEEVDWGRLPEAKTVDHPALTLPPDQTGIVINDKTFGSTMRPRSVSIAVLYADESGAGGDLRLQFDVGKEGLVTRAYFNDTLIGSEFTSSASLMEMTDRVETMVTQSHASNDSHINKPLTLKA